MAFAAAGITQTYLERILGFGYLETQAKIQVHFLMLVATGRRCSPLGVALFLWDFFFLASRKRPVARSGRPPPQRPMTPRARAGRCPSARAAPDPTGRRAIPAAGGAVLPAVGDEIAVFETCHARAACGDAQGPDRLRQDAVRRAHGVAPRTAARHRRLPRRSLGQRSHRPLPDSRRRDRLARRAARRSRRGLARSAISTRSSKRARTPSSSSIP